MFCVLI